MVQGLSKSFADEQLKKFGPNELPSAQQKQLWRIAYEVLKEPMFLLLLLSGTFYFLLGDYKESLVLLSTIFVIISITFYQYTRTERALQSLRDLSSPRALVIRDGQEIRIAGREVVPMDLLVLNEGDRIPADAQLTEATNLLLDESLFTGESQPLQKSLEEGQSQLLSATLIVQGRGKALVTKTGTNTEFGKIGLTLQNLEDNPTRFQLEIKILVKRLAIIGILVSIAVVLAFYLSRGNFLKSLLSGLAASMSILPEEFPVVLTIFLALGAWRLSLKNVLTRKPSAIETLGSATVLCTDKTGTITQNKMQIQVISDGLVSHQIKNVHAEYKDMPSIIQSAFRASLEVSIDPMEQAIQEEYYRLFDNNKEVYTLIREYPLSKHLMAMTRVLKISDDPLHLYASAKGAPEAIFEICKLSKDLKQQYLESVIKLAKKGYRVLGVASAAPFIGELPETQTEFNFKFQGLIGLADPIRPEVPEAISKCYTAGIKVIMITGDYP
jgi:Ca2+-transporting ATPase